MFHVQNFNYKLQACKKRKEQDTYLDEKIFGNEFSHI